MMEFCKHTYRTARKAHTCALCESIIRPFSRYVETTYKSDGKITRDRYHITKILLNHIKSCSYLYKIRV